MKRAFQKLVDTIPKIIAGCVILFISQSASAQVTELWTSLKAEYKISKKQSLNFTNGLRFTDDLSSFKSNLLELGLRHKLNKKMSLRLGYRFIFKDQSSPNAQRFSASYAYRKKVQPISFSLRAKYQYDYKQSINNGASLIRTRFSAQYRRKTVPIRPSVYGEFFFPFENFGELDEYRLGAALEYPINKKMGVEAKYFYRKKLNDLGRSNNIFGLGFSCELN